MAGACQTVTLQATEQKETVMSHYFEVHNIRNKYDKFVTSEESLYPILATWE
jgi:hypothetical protein